MPLFKFGKQRKDDSKKQQIYVKVSKGSHGIEYTIQREAANESLSLPLKLSIIEMRQQGNLSMLEILEELWYEEFLIQENSSYILPYEKIYELPSEVKEMLSIPEETIFDVRLSNEGAIGTTRFGLRLEKNLHDWKNIHLTGRQIGPFIQLADGTELLMEQSQFEFERKLDQVSHLHGTEIFPFIADVLQNAKNLQIPINEYLVKQQYSFINGYDLDVSLSDEKDELTLFAQYKSTDDISNEILFDMSQKTAKYFSDSSGKKYFVDPETHNKVASIATFPSITGSQIPQFIQNPEVYFPNLNEIDLSMFSERVKSLGVKVYKAQPFLHANETERGWFQLNAGFSAVDEEGEVQGELPSAEIQKLIEDAKNNGESYINWNGNWIEIPKDADEFIETSKNENLFNGSSVDFSKLPYIIEIFENISRLEYNLPLLDLKQQLTDLGVTDQLPPPTFKAQLKPFQIDGFIWMKWLYFRKIGGLLADDMGLGKTVQVLSLLSYLKEIKEITPTLIVAPKTLIENWYKEIQKFAPNLLDSINIHRGTQRMKDPSMIQNFGITLTTYNTLVRDQLVFAPINWQAIICDEAQAIKNPTTSASKVIKALKSKFRLAMTGTPVENGLSELWSILDYVQPGVLGSLSQFKQEFIVPIETQPESRTEEKLISRISFLYKRRTKNEELKGQLPEKTSVTYNVPMSPLQEKLYREVISLVQKKMIDGLQAIQKLKAISAHPALINDEYENLPVTGLPKLENTLRIIEEIKDKGEKVLIFTEYRKMQDILKKMIREKLNINPPIINGLTSRRMEVVEEFSSSPGFNVMILSPKAAGTGLTITSANHVIHYTRWWNPAVENQATDRVYRIGQEKPVTVYYPIVTDSTGLTSNGAVEEIVHRILEEKQALASNIITTSGKSNLEEEILNQFVLN